MAGDDDEGTHDYNDHPLLPDPGAQAQGERAPSPLKLRQVAPDDREHEGRPGYRFDQAAARLRDEERLGVCSAHLLGAMHNALQ
eukprot:5629954-Prymnesium_polylepis.1